METPNVPKNPFVVFTNFASLNTEDQQVLLNVILKVGNEKMRNEVLSDANRYAYPNLEWPEKLVKKSRPLQKARKAHQSGQVRKVLTYSNVCICTSFVCVVCICTSLCIQDTVYDIFSFRSLILSCRQWRITIKNQEVRNSALGL